ncbi:MAG: aspartyl/glutamyl-tRNA amidotransferase subunit A [Nanoarchaeota archaeon]|nr:aspartyl/glutamyl-tRNA amidotransferase subunit A [Nanoarchaeota archaeon]
MGMPQTLVQLRTELKKGNRSSFYAKLSKELDQLNRKYHVLLERTEPSHTGSGPLAGIPVSVKDCLCVKDVPSAAGSEILKGYIPPFDATAVTKVKNAGGVIIGKTAQDEFGFGSFSVNTNIVPKNPHDPTRSCGGSSGGAAALTAALSVPHLALAESTGGSIACPASFCGVVGMTPTYGLVSRYGLIDYANSLDKIGVITKSVADAELGLSVIRGYDPRDQTSLDKKIPPVPKRIVLGVPKEYFETVDSAVAAAVWDTIKKLEAAGIPYKKVSLTATKYALAAYYIIATAEASTNLAKYCGMRYGQAAPLEQREMNEYFSAVRSTYFSSEAKRRIMLGTFARMAGFRDKYFLQAQKVRTLVIQDFKKVFKNVSVLVTPTMPVIAPTFAEIEQMSPVQHYAMDVLTVGPNLAGLPHLSVPCGTVKNMPVGIQIIGDHLTEATVFSLGKCV